MKPYSRFSGYGLLMAVLVCAGGLLPQPGHAADSYLEELKSEAEKVNPEGGKDTQGSTPAYPSQGLPPQTVDPSETIKPGLDKKGFEQQLHANYYGSYLFYSTLPVAKRDQVYEEYKQKNDIKSIRESIMAKLK